MSDRPDIDKAIQILQAGGWNITGGKYAPMNQNPNDTAKPTASMSNPSSDEELREKLAAIEHERWADWQKWMHEQAYHSTPNGGLVFDGEYIEHLTKQINTPYSKLSKKEKASDMEQVDRYWPLIQHRIDAAVVAARLDELGKLHDWAFKAFEPNSRSATILIEIDDRIEALSQPKQKEGK